MTEEVKNRNGVGLAGVIVSAIALVLCWVPVLNWILWPSGLILSIIGVCKKPRTLGFVGLGISLSGIILMIILMTAFVGGGLAAAL
ncbi:MAG: hypothetical protein LBQ31_04480 [Bacteroidales bacterium]|nr:hypothetical protein [Bacteroidales bacterium]